MMECPLVRAYPEAGLAFWAGADAADPHVLMIEWEIVMSSEDSCSKTTVGEASRSRPAALERSPGGAAVSMRSCWRSASTPSCCCLVPEFEVLDAADASAAWLSTAVAEALAGPRVARSGGGRLRRSPAPEPPAFLNLPVVDIMLSVSRCRAVVCMFALDFGPPDPLEERRAAESENAGETFPAAPTATPSRMMEDSAILPAPCRLESLAGRSLLACQNLQSS